MKVSGLGNRIRLVRDRESIPSFAAKLGVHESTLTRYEKAKSLPDALFLFNLVKNYNVDLHWLLFEEGSRIRLPVSLTLSQAHIALRDRLNSSLLTGGWGQLITSTGISRDTIRSYSSGKDTPTEEELARICEFFRWDFETGTERKDWFTDTEREVIKPLGEIIGEEVEIRDFLKASTNIDNIRLILETVEEQVIEKKLTLPPKKKSLIFALVYAATLTGSLSTEEIKEKIIQLAELVV